MREFKLEVKIDDEGRVQSGIVENGMDPVEIIAFLEMQKFQIMNSLINKKKDEVKVEIIPEEEDARRVD